MFSAHGFNIGLCDNLIHIVEFLDLLRSKLGNNVCIYCERVFSSGTVLRKHMRKKKHFRVRLSNANYDRFYVSNYAGMSLKDAVSDDDLTEVSAQSQTDSTFFTSEYVYCPITRPDFSHSK